MVVMLGLVGYKILINLTGANDVIKEYPLTTIWTGTKVSDISLFQLPVVGFII